MEVIDVKEITIQEARQKAELWSAQRISWHFHMMPPDCVLNKERNEHALVLENETDNKIYVVYSDKALVDLDREFVQIRFGEQILSGGEEHGISHNKTMQKILQKSASLNNRKVLWHHHILFPDCLYNEHKGKWVILFENVAENEIMEAVYDTKPEDDLRRIEVLFFEQEQ